MLQGMYEFIKAIFEPLGDYLIGSNVPVASSFAGDIDALIALVTALVGFWALLAYAAFFFLIFRFRERDGRRSFRRRIRGLISAFCPRFTPGE